MLLRIPQALNPEELAHVRQLVTGAAWGDGRATAGDQSARVKNNEQLPEELPAAQEARHIVSVALARNPMFVTGALPKTVYPPLFNRYAAKANAFGDHIDNAVRTHAATARHVRTDISCTLFLSDPSSYDGGELVVQDTYGEQRIKFDAGDLVMYPGTSVHRVEPVTRGERLACFFWIESMVRRDDQRRLLYEMDMAILALRRAGGDTAETVKLTGCYHNLLRMWAEV
ncbi:Fe2+-dependent dioxygenase [Caenimonas aquaedulcis]|uniref:Fe2+-dependent dioxygenase n=1 Tax=Caenimonas aquaedulcis TaxID=2793270 RepID=A0A931H2D9_9BURK|nr:Fe2+-dependent dioxygenase [Caenimonas aquaedulcis]MBG9387311.1 Fe2+-dependent dioxygenase [Caenimonas aquaedulcis]